MEEQKNRVKGIVAEFFARFGVEGDLVVDINESGVHVHLSVEDAGMFIGRGGERLRALQHILLLTVSRTADITFAPGEFTLDINNYQREREQYLTALAKNTAHEVRDMRREKELPPMPASERRIIHLTIAQEHGVLTESVGDRRDRRVVVRPA